MALIRWQPFTEVEIMQRQINRLFDQMLSPEEGNKVFCMVGVDAICAVVIYKLHN